MTKHPSNRLQRRLTKQKKNKLVNEKKEEQDRSDKVWRKFTKEHLQQEEIEDDLQRNLR